MKNIIVIKSIHLGDTNNIIAMAEYIAEVRGEKIIYVEKKARINAINFLIPFAAKLSIKSKNFYHFFDRIFFKGDIIPHETKVDVVFSTLGAGEAPNIFLAKSRGALSIHLGRIKRMRDRHFDLVIAHQGEGAINKEVILPVSPSKVRLTIYKKYDPRYDILLAIGGNTKNNKLSEQFLSNLMKNTSKFSFEQDCMWYLTTSPRTGVQTEDIICCINRNMKIPAEEIVLYSGGNAKPIHQMLMLSKYVVVTADSVSMISDAISAGCYVAAAYWNELPHLHRIRSFLEGQVRKRQLVLWNVAEEDAPCFGNVVPLKDCWSSKFWDAAEPIFDLHDRKNL